LLVTVPVMVPSFPSPVGRRFLGVRLVKESFHLPLMSPSGILRLLRFVDLKFAAVDKKPFLFLSVLEEIAIGYDENLRFPVLSDPRRSARRKFPPRKPSARASAASVGRPASTISRAFRMSFGAVMPPNKRKLHAGFGKRAGEDGARSRTAAFEATACPQGRRLSRVRPLSSREQIIFSRRFPAQPIGHLAAIKDALTFHAPQVPGRGAVELHCSPESKPARDLPAHRPARLRSVITRPRHAARFFRKRSAH